MLSSIPTDAYRLLNLTASPDVRGFAGVAGQARALAWDRRFLVGALAAWIIAPLAAAIAPVCAEAGMRRRYLLLGLLFWRGANKPT